MGEDEAFDASGTRRQRVADHRRGDAVEHAVAVPQPLSVEPVKARSFKRLCRALEPFVRGSEARDSASPAAARSTTSVPRPYGGAAGFPVRLEPLPGMPRTRPQATGETRGAVSTRTANEEAQRDGRGRRQSRRDPRASRGTETPRDHSNRCRSEACRETVRRSGRDPAFIVRRGSFSTGTGGVNVVKWATFSPLVDEPVQLGIREHGIEEHQALGDTSRRHRSTITAIGFTDGLVQRVVMDVIQRVRDCVGTRTPTRNAG